MTALASGDMPDTHTSAVGSMYRAGIGATVALFFANSLSRSSTASTYDLPRLVERTAAGPAGQIEHVPTETTAEAVLEIRRRSGLTWEELGDLFDVSRRSVHHWASGKAVSAKHGQLIHRTVAALRHLDQGNQAGNRAHLLAIDDATGVSTLDLFKAGRFAEAMASVEGPPALEYRPVPLSPKARDARRPQPQVLLLEAEQDRPDITAKARPVRAVRTAKKTG